MFSNHSLQEINASFVELVEVQSCSFLNLTIAGVSH